MKGYKLIGIAEERKITIKCPCGKNLKVTINLVPHTGLNRIDYEAEVLKVEELEDKSCGSCESYDISGNHLGCTTGYCDYETKPKFKRKEKLG